MNEDELIADNLLLIRKGIEENNWNLVCEGYNAISGEDLKPLQLVKPSRIDNIRKRMNAGKTQEPTLPSISAVVEKKQKGGKLFGQGKITVISSEEDATEQLENKQLARPRVIAKRNTELAPIKGTTFGFNPSNERRDESRDPGGNEDDE